MLTQVTLYNELRKKINFFVNKLSLKKTVNTIGRKLALSLTDILTTALFKHLAQITTKKKLWELLEPECSYKTLVVNMNRFSYLALRMLFILLRYNRLNTHLVKHIDSTDIPVCSVRKAKYHQVMKTFANWGKTGKGWFYGLKMHLISDLEGRLLSIKFTSGNIDDREVVIDLSKGLKGIFIADAGYISKDLAKEFYQENKRIFLAKPRANMKKLATMVDVYLYGTRMMIELNFRSLKMFYGLVTSLPRSINGYLANYIYSILAYCLG